MRKGAEVFTSAPFSVSRVRLPQMRDERQSLKKRRPVLYSFRILNHSSGSGAGSSSTNFTFFIALCARTLVIRPNKRSYTAQGAGSLRILPLTYSYTLIACA